MLLILMQVQTINHWFINERTINTSRFNEFRDISLHVRGSFIRRLIFSDHFLSPRCN